MTNQIKSLDPLKVSREPKVKFSSGKEGICPTCGSLIFLNENICPSCKQRIHWGDKSIAKKVTVYAYSAYCPTCGKHIDHKLLNCPHCYHCGQKLDWSEE